MSFTGEKSSCVRGKGASQVMHVQWLLDVGAVSVDGVRGRVAAGVDDSCWLAR